MVEETKKVVEVEQPEATETTTDKIDGEQQVAQEPKVELTQAEFDQRIEQRLGRERKEHKEKLAGVLGKLGIDSIDNVDEYVASYTETKTKLEQRETALTDKDNQILLLRNNIKEDKVNEALALAKLKDLPLDEALKQVVAEFPNLTNTVKNFGIPAGTSKSTKKDSIYTREFLIQNQSIPYYKNLLNKMEE